MRITILVDDKDSWFIPYAIKLQKRLIDYGKEVKCVFNQKDVTPSDICFLLSCKKIVGQEFLKKNNHNIVVHASDLPRGKGFSPLAWQIMEGNNEIILTLFEVTEDVDAGPYYMKEKIVFLGTELLDSLHNKMANRIIEMCIKYVMHIKDYVAQTQEGESTFYPRRMEKDDELNIDKTIREQFNHLRIADNERHPLWFVVNEKKYYIKVYEEFDM